MDVAKVIVIDAVSGLSKLPYGPIELWKLKAVEEEKRPPPKPRERTVLQMRREKDGLNTYDDYVPATNKKADPIQRYLCCAGVNIVFAVLTNGIILPLFGIVFSLLPDFLSPPESVIDLLSIFTLFPMYILTRIINAFIFADIASACYKRVKRPEPPPIPISRAAGDFIASILLELVFVVQTVLVAYLPLPGVATVVVFVHKSLLNALYSFEYFWMSSGVSLKTRISRVEERWPFFLGFGAPLTVLTSLSENPIMQGCIFGALFPLFIISSYDADWKGASLGDAARLVPALSIFLPSRLVTDKLSLYVSEKLTGQPIRR